MVRVSLILMAAIVLLLITGKITRNKNFSAMTMPARPAASYNTNAARLESGIRLLQSKIKRVGAHTGKGMLVDLSIASGRYRFFVVDLQRDSILMEGLVTHGYGYSKAEKAGYSNQRGSYASSPGTYLIGKSYHGRFGKAYKLQGLDSSNNNAYCRNVVLHAHACVPEKEVHPQYICMSQGCPTVSPDFFKQLSSILDTARKPVLLQVLP